MLIAFSMSVREYSVQDPARRSEGGGGSTGYHLFRRPPICYLVWVVSWWARLGFRACLFVGLCVRASVCFVRLCVCVSA